MVVDTEGEALEDTEKVVQGEGVGVAGLEVAMGLIEAVVVVEEVGQKVTLEVKVPGFEVAWGVKVGELDMEGEVLIDGVRETVGVVVGVAGKVVAIAEILALVQVVGELETEGLEVMVTGLVLAAAVRVVLVDMEGELLGERDAVIVGLEVTVPGLEVAKGVMVPVMQVVGDMEGVEETVKVAGLVDTTPVRVILVDMEGEVLEVTE